MDNRIDRLYDWAESLTEAQKDDALVACVDWMVEVGMLSFYRGSLAPYYEGSGEPLVPGQRTCEDD